MVSIPDEVKAFVQRLRKKFPSTEVYLFGSRARRTARQDSDWDFFIVSDSFRRMDGYRRSVAVYKLSPETIPVDVLCYTPEEFTALKSRPSIVREARKEGALIKVAG